MKKFLSVFLSFCLLFAFSATLTSCMHKCEFSSDWSKDESSHWHACTGAECTEIADKAEHTWDEGKITTKATQEADGVKTFTCTVCAQTKTEAAVTSGAGITVDVKTEYKFTKDNAWYKITMGGESEEEYAPDKAFADEVRSAAIESIKAMVAYENYEYDAATKTYKANKEIDIEELATSTSDVTLTFADGKLAEIKYSVSFTQGGIAFSATSTISIFDYGTVVLNP